MKQRKITARKRMNMVMCEINNAILLTGGHSVDFRLRKEEAGLRLFVRGDFDPNQRHDLLRVQEVLTPPVRDPALVETYWELAGDMMSTGGSQLTLVGHMLDLAKVEVGESVVEMELYLAF